MPGRRAMIMAGIGVLAAGGGLFALRRILLRPEEPEEMHSAIGQFTGGAPPEDSGALSLTAPEHAENGAAVTVSVDAPGAEEIRLFSSKNFRPDIFAARFGPMAGSRRVTTRIRLAESQEIVAVARMADGQFQRASAFIGVTIGGCVA